MPGFFDLLERGIDSTGPDRVVDVVVGFAEQVIENPGMNHWLATEGDSAMSLLTRSEAGYRLR